MVIVKFLDFSGVPRFLGFPQLFNGISDFLDFSFALHSPGFPQNFIVIISYFSEVFKTFCVFGSMFIFEFLSIGLG